MTKKRIILIGVLILLALSVMASTFPLRWPPASCVNHGCSPGYWKNHTEVWMPYITDAQWASLGNPDVDSNADALAALKAKGNESMFQYRPWVAAWLNAVEWIEPNCSD